MTDGTRRAIAYIAVRLINGAKSSDVYDYQDLKYYRFDGDVSADVIAIYNHDQKCYISGSGRRGEYTLHNDATQKQFDLVVNGNDFHGYDFQSGEYFSGNVYFASVSIYDYEYSRFFNYSV